MLRGHVFSEQVFAVDIFALFINQFLGGNNGIIEDYKNAMEMTNTSNSITIKNGAAVIQGRYLEEHTETTLNYAKTDSLYCSLVIEIDLGKTNTRTSLEQAQYKILEAENDYPTLIQNDIINQTGNIYQFELARFQNGSTGIVNFTDRRNYLSFDSVYSGIIQDNLESDSPTSALSARQGKILNKKHYITAYLESNQTGGQNTTIQLNQTEVQKGNLTLSNNKVVIGQGISKVRISGEIFYQDFDVSNQYYLWGHIKKNNSTIVARCMTAVGATSGFATCSIATKIIEVQQGDVIELNFGDVTNHTVSVRGGKDVTYLSVEAVE